ncbi:MAG TPA: FAD binding domain-containing protein, partial [Chloroflexia bacterium]|nr:FAD binding domain-containing protein [Chloroflexia bacterium]
IPGLNLIQLSDGALHIGALVTLDAIDRDATVRARYQALAEAAGLAASPQLRNMGTLGGNLGQESRCWYYRNADFPCWLKGGDTCFARAGDNSHHAIFTTDSPCVSVHPSDPATALLALDAVVRIQGPGGERRLPIAEYLTLPQPDHRRLNALGPADLIVGVELPHANPEQTRSRYLKAMDRAAWSFALVGIAVSITWAGADRSGPIERVAVALGGVAPVPRRAAAAEAYLAGKTLDIATAAEAGRLACEGAVPLEHNAYKVRLLGGLVGRALLQTAGVAEA